MEKRKSISLKEVRRFFPDFKEDKDHLSLYSYDSDKEENIKFIEFLKENNIEYREAYYGFRVVVK